MLLVMLVYLLLAVRITVCAGASVCGIRGSCFVEAGALGFSFRIDKKTNAAALLRDLRVHGGDRRRKRPRLLRLIRAGRFDTAGVHVRVGLGSAAETAVAAGFLRATMLSAASAFSVTLHGRVEPDFDAPCFLLDARGIYSFCAGDIILAAAADWIQNRKRDSSGKASH